jgi:AcrR family transcriptional regulator
MVLAAADLFAEQGYDATTVAQIAERAGVTKSTFFRHFPDKRELLVAGQETLSRLLAEGIAEAPGNASPLGAVAAGLERASTAMGPVSRELAPRLKAAVAASAELQERDALKSVSLAAAMTTALIARGVPDPTAALASELGVLAFKRGYAEWSEGDHDAQDELAQYTMAALDELGQRADRWADRATPPAHRRRTTRRWLSASVRYQARRLRSTHIVDRPGIKRSRDGRI